MTAPDPLRLSLEGETDIVIRRDFRHPPSRVWRALTEPDLIAKWLGDGGFTRCEVDLREGGSFRYDWPEFSFFGPILRVTAPHRMVHVEHFSRDPAYSVEITTDLDARGTGTRMTKVMRYTDAAARVAAVAEGFTDGMEDVYGRIDSLSITD